MDTKNRNRPAQPGTQRPDQRQQRPRQNAGAVQEQVFHPDGTKRRPRSPEAEKRAQQRRRSAQRQQERKRQEEKKRRRPKVAYTQPKPFNLSRLLLQLAVVVAVVLAITMGLSVFFKVERVMVYGIKAYSADTVREASGIEFGENLMRLGNARACGKIKAALPYVDTVRIGIKLPDTVNIYIEEFEVAYAIQDQDSGWWLMTSNGRIVERIDGSAATDHTKVLGVQLDSPVELEQARALEQIPETTGETQALDALEMTLPASVTGADRLEAALLILDALEQNDMVGKAASVDVSSIANLELWYGQQYQVKLGDTANMVNKVNAMKQAISQQQDYETGILDVSFTTWPDQVGFTPFG